jgi:hypothetical protein
MLSRGALERPQREGLPSFKIGILVKNKIKTPVVARTDERFVLAKNKGIERAPIFPASNRGVGPTRARREPYNGHFGEIRNSFRVRVCGLDSAAAR